MLALFHKIERKRNNRSLCCSNTSGTENQPLNGKVYYLYSAPQNHTMYGVNHDQYNNFHRLLVITLKCHKILKELKGESNSLHTYILKFDAISDS